MIDAIPPQATHVARMAQEAKAKLVTKSEPLPTDRISASPKRTPSMPTIYEESELRLPVPIRKGARP